MVVWLLLNDYLCVELDRVSLLVGMERFGQYLINVAVPADAAAHIDEAVPVHADDDDGVGIHAAGVQCPHALRPIDGGMHRGGLCPFDAVAVNAEIT